VAPNLKNLRVEQGEFVYRKGDYATEMYFIIKGKVEFLFFEGTIPIVYAEVLDGYYFGELDLLFSKEKTRYHSVRAGEVTELLALSNENFH